MLLCSSDLHWGGWDAPHKPDYALTEGRDASLAHLQGRSPAQATMDFLNRVLDKEQPNLVIYSGDNTESKELKMALDSIFSLCISRQIHFACILGNRDDEYGYDRTQVMEHSANYPFSLCKVGPRDIAGAGNYNILIQDAENGDEEVAFITLVDSGGRHPEQQYDWIKEDQIEWFKEQSPSKQGGLHLVWMHIPPREIITHQEGKHEMIGQCQKEPTPSGHHTEIYSAMREKGVLGCFFGHNHVNDFAIRKEAESEEEEKEKPHVWQVFSGGCSFTG